MSQSVSLDAYRPWRQSRSTHTDAPADTQMQVRDVAKNTVAVSLELSAGDRTARRIGDLAHRAVSLRGVTVPVRARRTPERGEVRVDCAALLLC